MPAPSRYGGATYAGSTQAYTGRDSGLTVPGYDAVYYWQSSAAAGAYGSAAYGGRSSNPVPSAGLFASPDPATGVITVPAWWAYASYVSLYRITRDGERQQVRQSPVQMPSGSRHNNILNPKAKVDLTGLTAGTNTTLSRLTGQVTPSQYVTTAIRSTATAAGNVAFTATTDPANTIEATYGFWVRTSAAATDIRLSIQWFDINGVVVSTQTYPVSTTARTQAVNAWSWATVTVTTYPTDAATGVLQYSATGLPLGGTMDVTGRILEIGNTLQGDYFDGDFPGGSWTGLTGVSYSEYGPIVYVVDGEAPLDTWVRYELSNPLVPGFTALSEEVILTCDKNTNWLTHPADPEHPFKVWVEAAPERTRKLARTVHEVINRSKPVVVSGAARVAEAGAITFITEGFVERDKLKAMTSDGTPLLLRAPAYLGYPGQMWLSLGDETEKPPSHYAPGTYKRMEYDFQIVDAPISANANVIAA